MIEFYGDRCRYRCVYIVSRVTMICLTRIRRICRDTCASLDNAINENRI